MKNLKQKRQKAKLSQQVLADMLGVNEKTIRRWEQGVVPYIWIIYVERALKGEKV